VNIFKELSVFNAVTFVESTHTYFIHDRPAKNFSVTGLIKLLKPTFDVEKMSQRVAKKRGVSQTIIKEEWELNNKLSTTLGSILHKYIENFYSNKKIAIESSLVSDRLQSSQKQELIVRLPRLVQYFLQFYKEHSHLLCAKTELVVGDINDTEICGMIDLLAYNKNTDSYEIIDFKTNKRINTRAKFNTELKAPFKHMPDCELTHYTIQLNSYKYILEKYTNIKITGMKIVWFNLDNETFKLFELDDIQPQIKEAFELISSNTKKELKTQNKLRETA
jgi:hypothetical protein